MRLKSCPKDLVPGRVKGVQPGPPTPSVNQRGMDPATYVNMRLFMNARLIVGALATAAGFIGIAISYLGARNPREPKWAGEMIMGSFIVPLSLGGIVLGLMLLLE